MTLMTCHPKVKTIKELPNPQRGNEGQIECEVTC